MRNGMTDLRNHLFETLERLKDPDPATPMTLETASAICDVAKVIVDTQRCQTEYYKVLDMNGWIEKADIQQANGFFLDNTRQVGA